MATLNYIGSKKSLLNFIDYVLKKINPEFKKINKVKFLDGFAGSGIVGKYFNQIYGYNVFSNDMENYSYVLSYALLKVEYTDKLKNIIEQLNQLTKPIDENKFNLITENYSEKGKEKRKFWTISNSQKADAIIENIKTQLINKTINFDEYMFLLASLLSSIDKYANTASVYGAYLKKYKSSSLKNLELKPIHTDNNIINSDKNCNYNVDVNSETITNNDYDITYFDPPYNNRQYSSNYHPLNFISKYDSSIIPYGKTGLLEKSNKSNYSISKNVEESFKSLIEKIETKYILLSYNNEGIMSSNTIRKILKKKGKTTLYKYEYKKFKSQSKQENETVYEYLYLCEVGKKGEYSSQIVEL
jgi:adenine-specific DNA-methyltransferase